MSQIKSALIIANYEYSQPGLSQLVGPARDAESLARVLADTAICGFDVQTLINEPSHRVALEIESFCDNRTRDDLLLLYFSGHGIKDSDGLLYFATVDTRLVKYEVRRSTAVSAHFVNHVMNRSRSRRQILLLDCCYSGAFKEGMLSKDDRRVGTSMQFEGQGRVVLTASDALQYSFEGEQIQGEGVRSIFTSAFVRGLETGEADLDRDGSYSLDEVYEYVHTRVSEGQPEQKPVMMGYIEGKIFIGRNPKPKAAPLPIELLETIEDRRHWVRLGAVLELEKMLGDSNKGRMLAAQSALTCLSTDDPDLRVRVSAQECLKADSEARIRAAEAARLEREAAQREEARKREEREAQQRAAEAARLEQEALEREEARKREEQKNGSPVSHQKPMGKRAKTLFWGGAVLFLIIFVSYLTNQNAPKPSNVSAPNASNGLWLRHNAKAGECVSGSLAVQKGESSPNLQDAAHACLLRDMSQGQSLEWESLTTACACGQ